MRSLAARPRPAAAGRPPRPTRRRLPTPRRSLPPPAAAVPSFVDAAAAAEIQEPAARDVLEAMVRTPLHVEGVGTVQTAWVGNGVEAAGSDVPPVVLLHGFDSSLLEFRRLLPRLAAAGVPAYGVDLVGWGFTDYAPFTAPAPSRPPLGPPQKRAHLRAFCETVLGGRRAVVVGTSLGGAIAIDFALANEDLVAGLVLVAPQTYTDGIGPLASLPEWAARLGVKLLRTVGLRSAANRMAYHDTNRYATDDALKIGRLHTHAPGWEDANVAFIASGGYRVSDAPRELGRRGGPPTLVVWGADDGILPPGDSVERITGDVGAAGEVVIVDACGHCPHLEQAERLAGLVSAFARRVGRGDARVK